MQELPFLHSTRLLMLIDICMKFRDELKGFPSYRADTIRDGQTDRQTDGQTDRHAGKNNMSPDPEGGRHNWSMAAKVGSGRTSNSSNTL